jgi:NAD(P)-dependent dehydrogenase (short-subunit alcohol dehydrogenase family)
MTVQYQGMIAVVTGAASGIGRALTLELAHRGARVAASDVDEVGLQETLRLGGAESVSTYRLDVADRAAVRAHADAVVAEFGRVNLVVNNAGVAVSKTVEEMTYDDLDWLLGINLYGVLNGSMAFLPHLIASGDGHLVNLSSVFGLIAPPMNAAYSTAKFGVRGFTECLRQEVMVAGHPVTVHSVHPGGIRTNIARNARIGETARAVEGDPAVRFERIARTSPEAAARAILRGVERGKPRILVGPDAYVLAALPRLLGTKYEDLFARLARRARDKALR